MARWLTAADVRVWISQASAEQVEQMISLAESQAIALAPQLATLSLSDDQKQAVRGILLAAIRRWWDADSGAASSRTVGPFSETLSASAIVGQFYPSEVKALSRIGKPGRVFSVSMDPGDSSAYPAWVINAPQAWEES
ncbi:MAG: hypothetical protein SPI12_01805 [Actinomycetaceae bacterium]|nr:hypothetical protein [Actinomycetaceae bacterium]MDY6082583.1 hypothetical protein [Actinomycetaceae bacterium]